MYKIYFQSGFQQLLMAVKNLCPFQMIFFPGGLRLFRIDINQCRDAASFRKCEQSLNVTS